MPEAPGKSFPESTLVRQTAREAQLDLAQYEMLLPGNKPPTGPVDPRGGYISGEYPPQKIIEAPSYLSAETKQRILAWAKAAGLNAYDVANLMRSNVATFDLSYLRQQALLMPAHPVAFAQSFKDALRSIWSADYAKQIDQWIKSDPDYKFYDLAQQRKVFELSKTPGQPGQWVTEAREGRDFLRPLDGKLAERWERVDEYMILGGNRPIERLAQKIPWINISSRAYITGMNSMNWRIYKGYLKTLHREQRAIASGMKKLKPLESFDFQKEAGSLASMLADMSGRGPVGPLKTLTPALNTGFFSLRTNIGRLISPRHLFSQDKWTRGEAWKNFLTGIGAMSGVILGGRQLGLWDVETDNTKAQFMQPKISGTYVDVWGGYLQYAVLYGRFLDIAMGGDAPRDPVQLAADFSRKKLAPAFSQALMAWTGKDFKGEAVDRSDWKVWLKQNVPLSGQSIYDAFAEHGLLGLAFAPLSILGIGVSTYELDGGRQRRQPRQQRQQRQPRQPLR
jgi:hypothetical protein